MTKTFSFQHLSVSGHKAAGVSVPHEDYVGKKDIQRKYRKTSSISRTKFQNINFSYHVLQLYLPNPLKPNVKLRMKMQLEQCRQAMLQLHLSY